MFERTSQRSFNQLPRMQRNKTNNALGIGVSTESDNTVNEDTPVGVASAVNEGVTPSVIDMTVKMEKQSSLENTTVLGSFPPLSTLVTSSTGNAPGKSSLGYRCDGGFFVCAFQLRYAVAIFLLLEPLLSFLVLDPKLVFAAGSFLFVEGIGVSTESDDTMNEDTPVGVASAVNEGVTPSVIDMTVEMEKQSSLENTTVLGSFPPLSTLVTSSTGNAPGKSSYANDTGKPSGKKLNIHTLFTPGGNGIDVVVPVESIRAIIEQFANTTYGFFLGNRVAYPVVANYVRNTWGKYDLVRSMFNSSTRLFSFQFNSMDGLDAMLENGPWFIRNNPLILTKWHPYVNLLKKDVKAVPVWVKLHGVPVTAFSEDGLSAIATKLGTPLMLDSYTSDMCMQSWGRSSYARVMIELRADVELKDNIIVDMSKITGDGHYICNICVEYEWKPPRCASCMVFGHIHKECPKNTGFKPQKDYRPVPKKPTANSGGNKKKGVEPTIEVSNSNPFEVLNSVDNDEDTGTTSVIDKIWKFEELLTSGQDILVDEADNPLKKVEFLGDYDSEDEVASVDNDMARSMASERVGFGTQSLLEQWRNSYGNSDYDDDPYDDDM
ncbi:retrotransposon protein, putative, ty1-copia subclass [Tanacetum coccineum]